MFIDIHCHFDLLEKEVDLVKFIKKCSEKNVDFILTNGVNVETNRKSLKLAEKFREVKAALGIYPSEALAMTPEQIEDEIEFIKIHKDKISCIGEVGMDFKEDSSNKEKQERVFRKFIALSLELNKPITVHSRKAESECIKVLEDMKAKKVIMHYFSGKLKLVDRIVSNGWYLSIPTAVKNSQQFQEIIKLAPIENLLCETDSPYSHPDKKYPNTPENVIESYKKIAELKKISLEEAERAIEKNFRGLFHEK